MHRHDFYRPPNHGGHRQTFVGIDVRANVNREILQ